jgi:hypothetical protein
MALKGTHPVRSRIMTVCMINQLSKEPILITCYVLFRFLRIKIGNEAE